MRMGFLCASISLPDVLSVGASASLAPLRFDTCCLLADVCASGSRILGLEELPTTSIRELLVFLLLRKDGLVYPADVSKRFPIPLGYQVIASLMHLSMLAHHCPDFLTQLRIVLHWPDARS